MLLRHFASKFLISLILGSSLTGCYKLNYFIQDKITKDPPPPRSIDTDANLYFVADVDINPDNKYTPQPVPLTLVQLKDNNRYLTADSEMIVDNPEECLKDSALEYYHFKINPGQNKDILIRLRPETRFLAVIGKYQNPISIKSRDIVELPKLIVKDHYYTYVTVNPTGVAFIPE